MVKRKPAKKAPAGGQDFASFMSNLTNNGSFVNVLEKEENFYKFGEYNLDRALGGGLPAGQIYAFQGPASSGKSLAALEISKRVVEQGKRVVYFDTENKISRLALRRMGLLGNELFMMLSSDNLEDTLDNIMQMAESDYFGLLVVDSTDALVTDEQEERDIHEGSKVGGYKAKIFSEWMGKISSLAAYHECSVLLVRQVRDSPTAMFSNPEVTSGGKAIEFYATTILRFGPDKSGNAEENGKLAYQGASVRIKKMNQGALPKDAISIRFYIGDDESKPWGIDRIASVYDEARFLGILAPAKPTATKHIPCDALCAEMGCTPEELTFNGAGKTKDAIMRDPALFEALVKIIDECDGQPIKEAFDDVEDFEELD